VQEDDQWELTGRRRRVVAVIRRPNGRQVAIPNALAMAGVEVQRRLPRRH
jgi:hypothetical protein